MWGGCLEGVGILSRMCEGGCLEGEGRLLGGHGEAVRSSKTVFRMC